MTKVPDWRPGAVYHRALTDSDDLATGREVTVYPTLFGGGRLCEGPLAADGYTESFMYEVLSHAVYAAVAWDGRGSPPGDWTLGASQTPHTVPHSINV